MVYKIMTIKHNLRMIIIYGCLVVQPVQNHYYNSMKENTKEHINIDTAQVIAALMYRIIGDNSSLFRVFIEPSLNKNGLDVFKIIKNVDDRQVSIYGSNGVAAAWGFHYYLKEYCHCHISWDGDQTLLPSDLPLIKLTKVANERYRYYQNVVTTSYSFVWWDWNRWEREIDWMALNGFNLVLAFNGQEEIWRRVYLELGLNNNDIDLYFTGPSFLSWNRMGNLRGWGGPLTKSWHTRSVTLQKLILKRMRELGIQPVLPGFAGYVPRGFTRIYPNAKVTPVSWLSFQSDYCCLYFLSPLDDLFVKVGTTFLREYIREFGTDHIYNCDPFNEMTPASSEESYISSVGKSIFSTMIDVDDKAIWMMQGWLFRHAFLYWTKERSKALLTSVPVGRMLILDLQAEQVPQYSRLDSFFGQPFIWCMLHNFGGTLGLHGNANSVNENIFKARLFQNSTMVGTGITPEGINQNYVIYDLMNEMSWRKVPVNLNIWFQDYSRRRYNFNSPSAKVAWRLLLNSVYNFTGNEQHGYYTYVLRPTLHLQETVWYNKHFVWRAWAHILEASNEIKHLTGTYLYDLVDITRQSLQLCLCYSYKRIIVAFKQQNIDQFNCESKIFLEMLTDMDRILSSNEHFLLGKWLHDAQALGTTPLEKRIYERNARNQITLWGPNGEINDYANKQWSGLVLDYYMGRWKIFFSSVLTSLINKTNFNEYENEMKIFREVEQPFTYSIKSYPTFPTGDPVKIAEELYVKWKRLLSDNPDYCKTE